MAHACNTLCAKGARHRVAFRTFSPIFQAVLRRYLPLLALSREETAMQGGHATARDTQHAMATKAWHICPHAQERRLT